MLPFLDLYHSLSFHFFQAVSGCVIRKERASAFCINLAFFLTFITVLGQKDIFFVSFHQQLGHAGAVWAVDECCSRVASASAGGSGDCFSSFLRSQGAS